MNKRDHASAFVDEGTRDVEERPAKRSKGLSPSPICLLPSELVTMIAVRCDEASATSFLCSSKGFYSGRKAYDALAVDRTITWGHTGPLNKFAKACAVEGHLGLLKWMYGDDDDTRPTMTKFASHDDGLTLTYRPTEREFHTDWGWFLNRLGFFASENGQLDVLKWLKLKGCPLGGMFPCNAASRGHLEVLKWLKSEKCPWDAWAAAFAANRGHLEILKWMRSEGCPWDKWTPGYAARGGRVEVLEWLKSEECPWDSKVIDYCLSENFYLNQEKALSKERRAKVVEWLKSF